MLLINDLSNSKFKPTFSHFSYIHLLEDLWCWQDVLHLSSNFVNMSSSRVTGTTGHIHEILYTFCSVLNQQLLSPKQQSCDRVSALWSSQKPGALLRRVKRGVKGDPHRLQCHFHILAVALGSSVKRYTNTWILKHGLGYSQQRLSVWQCVQCQSRGKWLKKVKGTFANIKKRNACCGGITLC